MRPCPRRGRAQRRPARSPPATRETKTTARGGAPLCPAVRKSHPDMPKRRDPNPSARRRKPTAPRRSTWPIFRAYTPIPDAFRVSGYGTAGIVRVQPNGRLSSAFFMLNLSGSGVDLMFGKETPDTVEALLRAGDRDLPPWQEGPADLAARYVWGAHALTQDEVDYPDESRQYLDMLPKFPGRRRQWRVSQMFAMHPPIASEELLIAIDDLVLVHGETPSHQEVAVATFMEFEVADIAAVRQAIRLRPEDFEPRPSAPNLIGSSRVRASRKNAPY